MLAALHRAREARLPFPAALALTKPLTNFRTFRSPHSGQRRRAEIDDPKHELLPGMFASFVIVTGAPVSAAAVPVDGVVREGDGTMTVWFATDGHHFTRRPIKVGMQHAGYDQILDGVKPGTQIVIKGAVFLDNLAVSGEHAVLTAAQSDVFIEDLNSTNGTYINGKAVKKQLLSNNDVVEVGKYRIKFLAEDAEDYEKTMILRPGAFGRAPGTIGAPPARRSSRLSALRTTMTWVSQT